MSNEESSRQFAPLKGVPGGTIICPKCRTIWAKALVSEYCPNCDIWISPVRGEGLESMVRLFEKVGAYDHIAVCPHCGEWYPGRPDMKQCMRCWHDLYPEQRPAHPSCVRSIFKRLPGLRG
jgi:uncharacterized paraquat-inducible protein A